ncbi:MAG: glycosyltransferase family 2 protein [Clostridiales bacterium]|nr:glycosyltransferase family 2 protein [Clostridiales bacterium]
MFLDQLALVSGVILKVFSLYFLVMCLFFRKKSAPRTHFEPKLKFVCLVAARNEEAVIGNLVRSLKEQNYPPELIEVCVIPNNCTDNTAGAAKAAGAGIIEIRQPIRSKGDALHYAIRKLIRREDIDCFMIFDADNIVDRNYLRAMNDAFMAGAQVTKSRIESKNPYDSWVSGCYGLYYNIFNNFFNESRSRLGLSPKLIGTGLGIRREVLLSMGGWNTVTIAEDTEFNADCVLQGCRIAWVPGAITYDETPESFKVSLKQRRRWIGGIMAVARERVSDLFYETRSLFYIKALGTSKESRALSIPGISPAKRSLQLFDMAMILIMPYLQVLSLIPTALIIISGAVNNSLGTELLIMAGGLVVSYVGVVAFGFILSVLSPYKTKQMTKSILLFPIFTLSWMPLCFAAMIVGGGSWEQITHNKAVSLRDLSYAVKSAA